MRKILLLIALNVWLSVGAFEMIADTITHSRIYPGTTHAYSISIPNGYDASAPACLYVGLDGPLYDAPAVIDSLIQAESMPVTIGVYFQPGVLKDPEGTTIRYNRSNEYDAIDDRLARFISEELLPAVAKHKTASGQPILISDNPDCRAISGASSGGIGAFVVAWQRPDLFRRVYTTCGTFVAMRGGDLLPAIVRKTEPLPLRIFMHDGSRDAWNPLFGHWYEQNQLLASSLKFAGYDIDARWDDSPHSIKPGTQLFPEAMAWLWRDFPDPLVPGTSGNNCLSSLLSTDSGWKRTPDFPDDYAPLQLQYPDGSYTVRILPGSQWLETATAIAPGDWQKTYLLHDITFTAPGIIGLAFDTDGNLYAATSMGIQIADQNGRVRAILRNPVPGQPTAFAFSGHTLYIIIDGTSYSRTIAAEAAASIPNDVKSQGPA